MAPSRFRLKNLQDHISAGGIVFTIKPKVSLLQSRFENINAIFKYVAYGAGKFKLITITRVFVAFTKLHLVEEKNAFSY